MTGMTCQPPPPISREILIGCQKLMPLVRGDKMQSYRTLAANAAKVSHSVQDWPVFYILKSLLEVASLRLFQLLSYPISQALPMAKNPTQILYLLIVRCLQGPADASPQCTHHFRAVLSSGNYSAHHCHVIIAHLDLQCICHQAYITTLLASFLHGAFSETCLSGVAL